VCVGYWPREKLLQHAQLVVQQGCGARQEGPECGLVHPSLVHLFVGLILIAIFGLFFALFFLFLTSGSIRTCLVRWLIAIFGLLPFFSFFLFFSFFFLCVWFCSHLPSAPGLRFRVLGFGFRL
jgi:hypothetical protein